jgi:hypothetical protein
LYRKGVRYVVVPDNSLEDEKVLPNVRNRIFITSDAKQRHRRREQYEIRQRKMRHFSLPANLSAEGKAELLVQCKNKIWKLCRETEAPFSFAINKRGTIQLRMDKDGNVHGRRSRSSEREP